VVIESAIELIEQTAAIAKSVQIPLQKALLKSTLSRGIPSPSAGHFWNLLTNAVQIHAQRGQD